MVSSITLLQHLVDRLEKIRKDLKQMPTNDEEIKDPQEYQVGIVDLLRALGQFWVDLQDAIRHLGEPQGGCLVSS